ncbi:MAG: FtsW/RodA/SpoVE family cell cycle protein, partial [Patescibacteria group bacterium]
LFVLSLVVPVILQPDFGSALVLLGIWFIMLLLTGVKKNILATILLVGVLLSGLAWGAFLQDYQKDRIKVFLNPTADPLGSGYNVTQAIIAIGSGNFWGRGLGFGSQSQLKFIPEAQTDFIFAVIAEELGFLGVAMVFALFGVIFWRLMILAKTASDDFGQFLIIGIMAVLLIHLTVNIGMNLGVMPVMGISLPFVSYGGSFLITCFVLMGLAQSVAVRR